MKVATILGSPRLKGNTATVLGWFEEALAGEHEVDRINVVKFKVNGCLGCYKCQETSEEIGCVQKDDGAGLYQRMMAADAIVYASPLYWWGFSAQIKPLIDRQMALVTGYDTPEYKSLIEGRKASLLVTCGGPIEDNADLIQGIFDRAAAYTMTPVAGKYVIPNLMTPEDLGEEAREVARQMAADLLA